MIQISGGKSALWWEQKRQMSGGKSDKLGGGKSDKGKWTTTSLRCWCYSHCSTFMWFFYDRHEWRFYFDSHVATLNTAKDLKILNIAASTKTCC